MPRREVDEMGRDGVVALLKHCGAWDAIDTKSGGSGKTGAWGVKDFRKQYVVAPPARGTLTPRDTGTGMSIKLHLSCLQSEDHNEPCQRGRVSEHPSQEKGGGQGCLAGSDACESARGRRRDRYPRFERCAHTHMRRRSGAP